MEQWEIENALQTVLSPSRYMHTLGVAQTAKKLAQIHGYDSQKAYMAGLLHDCARELSPDQLLAEAAQSDLSVDYIQRAYPSLLHGAVGKKRAHEMYGINDCDILEAIETHTTGKPAMGMLCKIIYLADSIEPGRSFRYLNVLKEKAEKNVDEAVYLTAQASLIYLIRRRKIIHPLTLETRNYYAQNKKRLAQ